MADFKEFGAKEPSGMHQQFGGSRPTGQCALTEAQLVDALDHTLTPSEQAAFDRHLATCADCSRIFIEASRGAQWLDMLKAAPPEPSAALLDRILAATSGATTAAAEVVAEPHTLLSYPALATANAAPAAAAGGNVIPFTRRITNIFKLDSLKHTLMQPRLAMTAAMAFFSIALTLNLTGVHVTQLRASDFKPSSIRRSFYDANARVVRSIDNLRVVYELESRVQDLQRGSDNNAPAPDAAAPAASQNAPAANQNQNAQPQQGNPKNQGSPSNQQNQPDQNQDQPKQPAPRPRSGSSRTVSPFQTRQYTASLSEPVAPLQAPAAPRLPAAPDQALLHFTPIVTTYDQQGVTA